MSGKNKKHTYSLITVEKAQNIESEGISAVHESHESINEAVSSEDYIANETKHNKHSDALFDDPNLSSKDDGLESALDNISEDDLNGSVPLDRMHKIIIAVLVIALIGFAVYFLMFM